MALLLTGWGLERLTAAIRRVSILITCWEKVIRYRETVQESGLTGAILVGLLIGRSEGIRSYTFKSSIGVDTADLYVTIPSG
jgi:hypothetical protein